MSELVYQDLSEDLKKEILLNSYKNDNLKLGFYSKVYFLKFNGKNYSYRFHSKLNSANKKINTIIFNGKNEKHSAFIKNSVIFFYDKELKRTLKIDRNLFEEEVINLGLSDDQKELLSHGLDVTLDGSITIRNNKLVAIKTSSHKKSFVADYSFFLGSNTLLLKESIKPRPRNNIKLGNS